MRLFKRWTKVIGVNFDWMISQVENHEALIESAIREMHESSRGARARLCEVQQAGKKIRLKCEELETDKEKWKERALSVQSAGKAGEQREKALECVKRFKKAEKDLGRLQSQALEHQKLESQLADDLNIIEEKISNLKQKKLQMSVKEQSNYSAKSYPADSLGAFSEIDEIFDRWEVKLARCEAASTSLNMLPEDELKSEFESKEEELEINLTLDEILREASS